jgi:hypothetical protein
MTNCRAISLLIVLSKVLKKGAYGRISQLLHTNSILVLGREYQLKMLPSD